MKSGLERDEVVAVYEIHEAVLLVDATGPGAGQRMAELLGFTDATEGLSKRFVEQSVEALEDRPIGLLPISVILPAVGSEDEPQSRSSLCSETSLRRAWSRELTRRRTLAGDRSR